MLAARRLAAVVAAAVFLALFVAPGCGGATVESVCGMCPETEDSCVKDNNEALVFAKAVGCEGEAQAVLDCNYDEGKCDSNGELDVEEACADEYTAYDKCVSAFGG